MSLIATLFLSSDSVAPSYASSPEDFAEVAEHGGIGVMEVSTLWAILRGEEWRADHLDEFPCLLNDGVSTIHRLPAGMGAVLAEFAPDQIREITVAWADTDEMDCAPDAIRPIVDDLIHFAGLARESGLSVYLYNC